MTSYREKSGNSTDPNSIAGNMTAGNVATDSDIINGDRYLSAGDEESSSIQRFDVDPEMEPQDMDDIASIITTLAIPNHHDISPLREGLFIFFICLSQLITQASVAQTIIGGTFIAKTFGVEGIAGEESWFTASFSLTVGTFILISGRLGDMYGYKFMYLVGYGWYAVTSLAVGFSSYGKSTVVFSIMRALQGMGPAITMPNSQAILGSYYPPSLKKNIYMCLFGAIAPGGFVLGALFTSMFSELVWWPWTFWLAGIVAGVAAVGAFFIIPQHIGISHNSPGSFDYWGSLAGVTGLVLINFAWNQGPNVGWDTPYVYVLLIVGVLALVAFYFIEQRVSHPIVPREALRGDTGFVLGCIAAGWSCFGIWIYYIFRWILVVDGKSSVMAAVYSIPTLIMGYVAALSTAYLLQHVPLAFVLLLAMCAFLIASIVAGTMRTHQIYWLQKFVSFLIGPFGMDMSFPAGCVLLSDSLPREQQGIAGSLVSTFVNYSIAIGLGIAGTVEFYVTKDREPSMETTIKGIKAAQAMGMGMAGCGILLSAFFLYKQLRRRADKSEKDMSEHEISLTKSETTP